MPALIAFLADLLKLPPEAVVAIGAGLAVVLLLTTIRAGFRYLERRSDNRLIAKLIEKSTPDAVVIQAIRGIATAGAATATGYEAEPVDVETDVDGVVRRVTGWMRDLKLPPGG